MSEEGSEEECSPTEDAYAMFKALHDPNYLLSDVYVMFAKLMELGIKDLYNQGNH